MDIEGEAMVLNFIGCSIQEEADIKVAASKTAIDFTVKEDGADMHPIVVQDTQYLKAIDFHKKHAAKTDIEGKFTAFTNLGIIYATLCIWTEAAKFHKKALRCAIFVQSSPDQCIAVGNLGFLLFRRRKMVVAKACISRYLMICRMLGDTLGLARSHYTLGQIALQLKKFREAKVEFTAAMNAAIQHGDKQIETFCKVQLGICKGNVLIATREKALEGYHPETSPFVEIKH
jgi:tetratricopeptide (TPR) repeat protein